MYSRLNCQKTIPFKAAHPHIGYIWEYTPSPRPLLTCSLETASLPVFLFENSAYIARATSSSSYRKWNHDITSLLAFTTKKTIYKPGSTTSNFCDFTSKLQRNNGTNFSKTLQLEICPSLYYQGLSSIQIILKKTTTGWDTPNVTRTVLWADNFLQFSRHLLEKKKHIFNIASEKK